MLLARLYRSLDLAADPMGSQPPHASDSTKPLIGHDLDAPIAAPRSQRGGAWRTGSRPDGSNRIFGIIPTAGVFVP